MKAFLFSGGRGSERTKKIATEARQFQLSEREQEEEVFGSADQVSQITSLTRSRRLFAKKLVQWTRSDSNAGEVGG